MSSEAPETVDDLGPVPEVPLAEGVAHDLGEWEKATAAVLRKTKRLADDAPDSDVWTLLSRRTLDGIDVLPLGTPATAPTVDPELPGQAPFTRGSAASRELDGWDVRGHFADPDPRVTAEQVVTDLENGVTSLWIELAEGGLAPGDLAAVLEPVFVDLAPVVLDAPADPIAAARALVAVVADKGVAPHAHTNLGVDPIGAAVRGRGRTDLELAVQAARLAQPLNVRAVVVDATAVHDAGASDAQELAYSLAAGATYLRTLTGSGLTVEQATRLLEFRYAATDEQFPTIAKLRAARRLWSRVTELSGAAAPQLQHAVTSRPMMTRYDPYVNMLRTTVASFAAGVGGATSVTVLPFDEALGLPDDFSRRIARNTSNLLISESHVAAVTDPAGGAHAVERLTDDLARTAWALFGEIERAGGVLAAIADGTLAASHADVVSERAVQVARRRRPVTGVSEFPNLHEELLQRRPYAVAPTVHRYAGEFEALRDDRLATPVFLATMGTIAQHTARATFAANLFAAGGIDTITAGATDGVDAVVAAYREAGSVPVACLAGTDAAYGEWGAELVAALREAGAAHVVLAGKTDVGADEVAAAGLDALDFLRRTREKVTA